MKFIIYSTVILKGIIDADDKLSYKQEWVKIKSFGNNCNKATLISFIPTYL